MLNYFYSSGLLSLFRLQHRHSQPGGHLIQKPARQVGNVLLARQTRTLCKHQNCSNMNIILTQSIVSSLLYAKLFLFIRPVVTIPASTPAQSTRRTSDSEAGPTSRKRAASATNSNTV